MVTGQRVLLHMCCAPCANQCVDSLRMEGLEVTGYWFNPNIHPYQEYKSRRNAAREYSRIAGLKLIEDDIYGLREFVQAVAADIDGRCSYCYKVRLEKTAETAARLGFDAFSTSLLYSPYQKHTMIIHTAQDISETYGVPFLYRDFRPLYRAGQEAAREMGLYRQKYCGCVFSEEERFRKKKSRG